MNSLMKEAIEFAQEFDYNDPPLGIWPTIQNPGKFEGEPQMTPYFWYLVGHSVQDRTEWDVEDDFTWYEFEFDVTEDDIKLLPELENIRTVVIFEDSQGFVYGREKEDSTKEFNKRTIHLQNELDLLD